MGRFKGEASEIPGAPPAGVSQPLKNGGFNPVGRYGSSQDDYDDFLKSAASSVREGRTQPQQPQRQAQPRQARPQPQPQRREEMNRPAQQLREAQNFPQNFSATGQPEAMNVRGGREMLKQREQHPVESVPLTNKRRRTIQPIIEFPSVDGRLYKFYRESAETKGMTQLAFDLAQAALIAIIEMHKGGSALEVFKAFRITMKDTEQEVYFDYQDIDSILAVAAAEDQDQVDEGSYPQDDGSDDNYRGMSFFEEET
jgi:hypothetical protein